MRHRIEDLGRIAVLIRNVLDRGIFDSPDKNPRRPKDVWEWFSSKSDDEKDDILRSWSYGMEDISFKLHEILSIAEGIDPLNEERE